MTPRDFILAHTAPSTAPLCPEIRLYLATEVTPLWQATEDYLAAHNLAPPYWAFPWVGGQALARHVLDNPDLVAGKRVLDFAAGCGIGAIATVMAGADRTEAAEIDGMAIAAIALNAETNGVTVEIRAEDVLTQADCPWDLILAGDVCYERTMADAVVTWLRRCAAGGATILLADPGRAYLPKTGLMRVARHEIPCSLEIEGTPSRDVSVYRVVG